MAKRKYDSTRRSSVNSDRGLKALYAKMRREFSAADLQKYTEIEEGVPAAQVLADLERIHRKYARKRA